AGPAASVPATSQAGAPNEAAVPALIQWSSPEQGLAFAFPPNYKVIGPLLSSDDCIWLTQSSSKQGPINDSPQAESSTLVDALAIIGMDPESYRSTREQYSDDARAVRREHGGRDSIELSGTYVRGLGSNALSIIVPLPGGAGIILGIEPEMRVAYDALIESIAGTARELGDA